ncbi:esterase/lipase family protein [Carbonactinospora thermoautotrophica]|uniref:esterase/lipase family protein n=1 Tax=Carbonactinospora thermoautotrophica TaxID=1469144 RepID=UPI0022AAC836|nr:alpha/beta fold hydrolase [Carbonactinospora thermoautotrophica]
MLLHGLGSTCAVFAALRRELRNHGFHHVESATYSPLIRDARTAAQLLAERVQEIRERSGQDRIHIVGHSLGGLIARYYVQRLGGDAYVDILITVGTPHQGTHAARLLAPLPVTRQLHPNSPLIHELAAPAPGCRTRFVAIYSDFDEAIIPARYARIDHPDLQVRNILVNSIGHLALPRHRSVIRAICTEFTHVDGVQPGTGHADRSAHTAPDTARSLPAPSSRSRVSQPRRKARRAGS